MPGGNTTYQKILRKITFSAFTLLDSAVMILGLVVRFSYAPKKFDKEHSGKCEALRPRSEIGKCQHYEGQYSADRNDVNSQIRTYDWVPIGAAIAEPFLAFFEYKFYTKFIAPRIARNGYAKVPDGFGRGRAEQGESASARPVAPAAKASAAFTTGQQATSSGQAAAPADPTTTLGPPPDTPRYLGPPNRRIPGVLTDAKPQDKTGNQGKPDAPPLLTIARGGSSAFYSPAAPNSPYVRSQAGPPAGPPQSGAPAKPTLPQG